jgi:hypothetical protein
VYAMKAYTGSSGIAPLILNVGTIWRWAFLCNKCHIIIIIIIITSVIFLIFILR